jgi:hypothetical protein
MECRRRLALRMQAMRRLFHDMATSTSTSVFGMVQPKSGAPRWRRGEKHAALSLHIIALETKRSLFI